MALVNRYTEERYTLLEEDGLESGKANYFWHKIVKLFNKLSLFDYKYTKTIDCSKCSIKKNKVGFNG